MKLERNNLRSYTEPVGTIDDYELDYSIQQFFEVREKHYREHTVLHMSWEDWNNFKLDDETYEYRYKENGNDIKENMKKKHESTVD